MKKYVIRANEQFLFDSFERSSVSALLGPRRVGKTTLIDYYMQSHAERIWVKLNMDVLSQRNQIANEELALMIEQAALQKIGGAKKIWVFIDEAQKCPALFDQIKVIYDNHKGTDHIKFILTGSAHLNVHQLTAETLAGRVELLNLREFNLRELIALQQPSIALPTYKVLDAILTSPDSWAAYLKEAYEHLLPFQKMLYLSLQDHIIWGGLPEVYQETAEQYRLKYLGDYLQTYLEKDIRAIDTIGDLNLYQQLIKISAELTGSVRDDQKIIEALHCSRITLAKYRNYLLATLQYTELYPFVESTIKRLVKSPKGYLINNGLVSYLTGIDELSILKTTGLIGHRFENWFLNEIQTVLDTRPERHQLYFWRTAGGAEVDCVITLGKQIIPVAVTYASSIESKKLHNLKRFMSDTKQVHIGIFCYMGPLLYDEQHRILFLPAWML